MGGGRVDAAGAAVDRHGCCLGGVPVLTATVQRGMKELSSARVEGGDSGWECKRKRAHANGSTPVYSKAVLPRWTGVETYSVAMTGKRP
jgi:hypothetical protein